MIKLCKDCRWSIPEKNSNWNLRCLNVEVNKKDPWALSSSDFQGSDCRSERIVEWFATCGLKGKKWESK